MRELRNESQARGERGGERKVKGRAHVLVSGKVQGVYYRSYAVDMASKLNLTGWVRNRFDGRVEAVLEGEEGAVRKMLEWCGRGSPSARVDGVEVRWEKATGEFPDFRIVRGE